jgi:hypothetical protein
LTVVLKLAFWLQSTNTLPPRLALVISDTTSAGSRRSSSCASALENARVCS